MSGYAEDDLWSPARDYAPRSVELGTVGWDDEELWYETGTGDNDGHTLVRVQLYAGKDPGVRPKAGVALGRKLLCQIADGVFRIPAKGTRCYVILPAGYEDVPGAGVIVATVSKNPDRLAEDRAVLDYGDVHLVIKAKSASLQSYDNEFISVGTPRSGGTSGLIFQAADGTGGVIQNGVVGWFVASSGDAKTLLQMTTSGIDCCVKGGGMWRLDGSFYTLGSTFTAACGKVYLGLAPTPSTPVLVGPSAGSSAASAAVFASPT